jgi:hypothetical protein
MENLSHAALFVVIRVFFPAVPFPFLPDKKNDNKRNDAHNHKTRH